MTKEEFWNWFDSNKRQLEKFITSNDRDYQIYDLLSEKLSLFSDLLIPELTIDKDGKFVLIVSCDGVKEGIPFVEALTENLREFDNWKIVKFRQASPMELIPLGTITLKRKNIYLDWRKSDLQKYYITFYVKGYSTSDRNYEIATLLHLDHTIGEYNSMTRIENVEIKSLGFFQSKKGLKTLDELKLEIES